MFLGTLQYRIKQKTALPASGSTENQFQGHMHSPVVWFVSSVGFLFANN